VGGDREHSWFVVWGATSGADGQPIANPAVPHTAGSGVTAAARYNLTVPPDSSATITVAFAGSTTGQDSAARAFQRLARDHVNLLIRKQERYASILARARVSLPDPRLEQVYNWVKVDAEWLVREVPGMGVGLGGGLMEYPWWFGTETYSLQALLATGEFDVVKQTLRLLDRQSRKANGNGRIVHEVTTNGAVSNPGNTQETAQFILTVARVVQWTADLEFAREMYPAMKRGITWLLTDMDQNRDLFPEGYGIMEVYGLNAELIDVAVYTQQALTAAADIAALLGDPLASRRYRRLASRLKTRINERFWIEEEGAYADFYGTRNQAIAAADGAIRQIGLKGADQLTGRDSLAMGYYQALRQRFAAMPERSRGWLTNQNWVIVTPLETGIAPRPRAIRLLDRIRGESGEYGPFLSAVERQAMMTISTGVQAVAEANYGRTDQALWYMDRIVQTFNRVLPGSSSEMMPDYGCFTIAWTSYGIVVPLIGHIFGIAPDAVHRTIVFDPHLPAGWEDIRIDDLPVGNNVISFARARTASGVEFEIRSREPGWRLVLKGKDMSAGKHYVNGKAVPVGAAGLHLTGTSNHVLVIR
jgi:hypothetical protein